MKTFVSKRPRFNKSKVRPTGVTLHNGEVITVYSDVGKPSKYTPHQGLRERARRRERTQWPAKQ